MNEHTEAFATLDKALEDNAELKDALLELQREAVAGGWASSEYNGKLVELLESHGVETDPEIMLAAAKNTGYKLTDEELDAVSGGGWGDGHDCNKWKDCGNGSGRTCYPHC